MSAPPRTPYRPLENFACSFSISPPPPSPVLIPPRCFPACFRVSTLLTRVVRKMGVTLRYEEGGSRRVECEKEWEEACAVRQDSRERSVCPGGATETTWSDGAGAFISPSLFYLYLFLIVVPREEKYMKDKFGKEYEKFSNRWGHREPTRSP